jgi:WS/DGAT/MGAT family acyltransferase
MSEPMHKADNFWLNMDEPTNLMVICALMEFDRRMDIDQMRETIEDRLLCFDRFKKKIVRPISGVGVPNWEFDKNFNIRSHLQRIALPSPGDKSELKEMISNLMSTPLDFTKPLWQIHVIENYGQGCVLFARIHHCIADGIALIHVLLSLTDKDPDAPSAEEKPEKKVPTTDFETFLPIAPVIKRVRKAAKTAQKIGETLLGEIAKSVSDPVHLIDMTRSAAGLTADAGTVLSKLTIMPPDPDTAFKGKLGVRKSATWTEPIPLEAIKTTGRAIDGSTINDVLIATVAGALRRYLKTRDSRVNELDLRMTVPVNIRKPGTEFELGNKFSTVFLALPVYIEDPVLRLKEVKRRMDRLKKSPDAAVVFGVMHAIGVMPPDMAKKSAQFFGNKASGVLTNVPGPRQPLFFAGNKIKNMMFWVPRSGKIGLGISLISYAGTVTVGIASDDRLLPDPEVLLEGFEIELNQLLELVKSGKISDEPLVLHDRYQETRCKGETKSGIQCKRRAVKGSKYCSQHQPKLSSHQCKAITKSGKPCKNRPASGSEYCKVHHSFVEP